MRMIDEDALEKTLEKIPACGLKNEYGQTHILVSLGQVFNVIEQMPTITPERKRGKWINDNCSECGQYVYHGDARNFCPNCGAVMTEDTP